MKLNKYIAVLGIFLIVLTIGVTASILTSRQEEFKSDWADREGLTEQELETKIVEDKVSEQYIIQNLEILNSLVEDCVHEQLAEECASALNNVLKK